MVKYKETKSKEINKATYDLQHLNITGNVIPHNWFNALRMENGAPDYQSIVLLSEIVYWYKPKDIFNEQGIQVGIGKKYDADTLQKSYDDLADKFGMTKRQVRDAIVRLENKGLIKRNFEVVRGKGNMPISNVLFIDLFVDKLKEITIVLESVIPSGTESVIGVCSNPSEGYPRIRHTYTKSTTKNTTKNKDIKETSAKPPSASKVKYEESNPYYQLANYLYQSILKNDPKAKQPNMQTWSDEIRKLVEIDERDIMDVKDIVTFATNHHFWKKNILSTKKLRDKFSTLYIEFNDKPKSYGQKKYQQPKQQVTSKEFNYDNAENWANYDPNK